VDGCRAECGDRRLIEPSKHQPRTGVYDGAGFDGGSRQIGLTSLGRFPANLIHDGSDDVKACFPETKSGAMLKPYTYTNTGNSFGKPSGETRQIHDGDSGNASRFFKSIVYTAKASKAERNAGCESLPVGRTVGGGGLGNPVSSAYGSEKASGHNYHPTVKPTALMEYLITMIAPPTAVILDPFMGSGTTGVAATRLDRDFIGIEMMSEYVKIAQARIQAALLPLFEGIDL
jgi:site-specific DNA-methyltransferase (adenine-specific)